MSRRPEPASWPVAAALLLLTVVPVTAGTLRLVQLAGGPDVMPADSRFAGFPGALIVHVVGSAVFAVLGVAQLLPRFRRRHLTWHRRAGRVLAVAGLLVAGSALWLTLLYPQKPGTGVTLFVLRLVFASAMLTSLVLGLTAIRRGDVVRHRTWMIRAYAIAVAAGTQVFTESTATALLGTGVVRSDLAKGAGWVINLVVAEWAIRRGALPVGARGPGRRTSARTRAPRGAAA
jgi:uncharacterized membrane protein YozB (DUF420 family)